MKTKQSLVFLLMCVVCCLSSCREQTAYDTFRQNIGKRITIDGNDSIYNFRTNVAATYKDLTNDFEFISVVYVEQSCGACRATIVEWTDKADSVLDLSDKYAVLFIFSGEDIHRYLRFNLGKESYFPYFVLCDKSRRFLKSNRTLPRDILNASVLIDKSNRIRLIGEPFRTRKIRRLYLNMFKEKGSAPKS